jgi:diguanylate cyclase (GGDEF)-like protein/PAS domain S-box-containing protein
MDTGAPTPYALLAAGSAPQRAPVPLLAAMTRHLENQALLLDEQTVLLANFQGPETMTPLTRRRYETLAAATALTAVTGVGMPGEPAPGVHGTALEADDPLADEWVVTVVSPHFAAALAARDVLGDASSAGAAHPSGGPGAAVGRRLEHVLTYDRPRVLEAAALLLDRARPQTARPMKRARPDPGPAPQTVPRVSAQELPHLVLRAVSTAGQGIVIADARSPDLPVVYVNEAFQRITGYPEEEVLGRNCRFLQGPATDPSQVQPISRRLLAGRDVHAVLLNHRRDGSAFWNEIRISAVRDIQGAITHYIGTQLDVTGRIDREQRTLYLAYHDELTGLPNRVQVLEHLELELRRARRSGGSVAVVLLDLDGFKGINDRLGHSAGDSALTCVAQRLRSAVRSGDLLGRFGGDEFLVVLGGLPPAGAATSGPGDGPPVDEAVARVREHLHAALDAPTELAGVQVRLRASSGAAVFPRDAAGSAELIALADAAMYRVKGRT